LIVDVRWMGCDPSLQPILPTSTHSCITRAVGTQRVKERQVIQIINQGAPIRLFEQGLGQIILRINTMHPSVNNILIKSFLFFILKLFFIEDGIHGDTQSSTGKL
jgi:hypothetical protein